MEMRKPKHKTIVFMKFKKNNFAQVRYKCSMGSLLITYPLGRVSNRLYYVETTKKIILPDLEEYI